MIANQATLKEITTYLPFTKKDLLQISGFGKAKVEKYGDEIIDTVVSFCERNDIETNMKEKILNTKKDKRVTKTISKIDTKNISFDLFKEGKSIYEIAEQRKLTVGTIEGHLAYFVGTKEIDINSLVSKEKQQQIKNAISIHGHLSPKTLLENLPKEICYGDIKMVLALEKN